MNNPRTVVLEVLFFDRHNELNVEDLVQRHYEGLGYRVRHNRKIGEPDFKIEKNGKVFYVEVKSETDALRVSQLKWLYEHPNVCLKLAIVEKNTPLPL